MSVATTTTVAALRSALVEVIRSAVDVRVQVSYGPLLAPEQRNEAVYLGNTAPSDHEPVALKTGRRHRRESYDTLVAISVSSKASFAENEARAVEIASAIESAIADDHTLGGRVDGLQWSLVRELSIATQTTDKGSPDTKIDMVVTSQADLR